MWLWWWTVDGREFYGPSMNSLLAHLLAALLADASAQLAGTPPDALPPVADRAVACGCDAGAGAR